MYDYIRDNKPNYLIELESDSKFLPSDLNKTIVVDGYIPKNISNPVKMGNGMLYTITENKEGYIQANIYDSDSFFKGNFNPKEVIVYDKILNGNNENILPLHNQNDQTNFIQSNLYNGMFYVVIHTGWTKESENIEVILLTGNSLNNLKYESNLFKLKKPSGTMGANTSFGLSNLLITSEGTIMIVVNTAWIYSGNFTGQTLEVKTSKDNGKSWETTFTRGKSLFYGVFTSHSLVEYKGKVYFTDQGQSLENYITIFNLDGTLKETSENLGGRGTQLRGFGSNGEVLFAVLDQDLYIHTGDGSLESLSDFQSNYELYSKKLIGTNFSRLLTFSFIDDYMGVLEISIKNGIINIFKSEQDFINNHVISIDIDKPKGMIASANVQLDNFMGIYAPDGKINPYKIWVNKQVNIYMGYGNNLKKVFKGYIDNIEMNSFPSILKFQCRDTFKLCKDQLFKYNNKFINTFKNKSPEELFKILCDSAKVPAGVIEPTGIKVPEIEFNYNNIYDCMEELADISGFELWADEEGRLHFRNEKPKKDQEIKGHFKEGINIMSMNYVIDDNELYHSVLVQGEKTKKIKDKEVTEIISYTEKWGGRNNFKLPVNKILRIESNETDNIEDLKKIGKQALYLMTVRSRRVSFQAIANEDLQVGDLIKVEETSSTISEIYRITGLSYQMNTSGYIMNIECYHHKLG